MKKGICLITLGSCLVIIGTALIIWDASHAGLCWNESCTTFGGGSWGPCQYWRGPGVAEPWDSAPNGWYHVQAGYESKNGTVSFPWCPSCGSQLHGTWNCTIFLEDNYNGDVYVKNNVIVEARDK